LGLRWFFAENPENRDFWAANGIERYLYMEIVILFVN